MNQSTLFRSQRVKWITLALLLAAFAALLTTSLTLAQSDSETIKYAENGTGPVANLAAMDPEGDEFTWAISGGYDEDYFEIDKDTGVLSFEEPPDFENPKDNGSNNSYVVEVKATEIEPGGFETERISKAFTITVEVTEVAEMGEVTWRSDNIDLVQFEVGGELVATLTDGDVEGSNKVPSPIVWQWLRADSMTDMGTVISGETTDSYTATSDDVGKYIRVMGTYTVGGGDDETAYQVSDYPVLAERADNEPPEFSSASVDRAVDEGMKGMTAGAPVTATDDGPGKLTYVLGGTDGAQFAIDRKSGQITSAVDLDYEADAGDADNCDTKNECEVTVTAYDSAGDASDEVTVTIAINNVNEAPWFTMGPKVISTYENRTALYGAEPDDPATTMADVTYEAMDPEGQNVNFSLRGDDRERFEIDENGVLAFKVAPDYEKPTDSNRDKVYEVTVRASDSTERTDRTQHDDRMVIVKVMDIDEAPAISGDDRVSYAENGTGPVFTFDADDPEADAIMWSIVRGGTSDSPAAIGADIMVDGETVVSIADAADFAQFEINSKGELTFSTPPDFENPRATPLSATNTNTYKVAVAACDGDLTTAGMICPDNTNTTNPAMDRTTGYHTVTVTVTNVPEVPKIALHAGTTADGKQLRQFDEGESVFANVVTTGLGTSADGTGEGEQYRVPPAEADGDGRATYEWYRSNSRGTVGTLIAGQTTNTYEIGGTASNPDSLTPHPDVGKYIHVVHNYVFGPNDDLKKRSVRAVTEYRVTPTRITTGDDANNDPPEFDTTATTTVMRSVNEGAPGMKAGLPVTAKDDAKRDLFYSIDNDDTNGPDNAKFVIDSKTGQITTRWELDFESTGPATAEASGGCEGATVDLRRQCTVTVEATNSDVLDSPATGTAGTGAVTITIQNVNEAPYFASAGSLKEEISHAENQTALDHSSDVELNEVSFNAMDPEDGNVTYTLRGRDADLFQIDTAQVLSFKDAPDFEMPADSNMDNVYEVTVRASDDTSLYMQHSVKIMVTNVNEPPNITGAEEPVTNAAPMFSADMATREVAENTAAGMNIGAPVTATDPDGDMLSYSLSGTDAASFDIGESTGQLMTMAALDYETKMSYMVMVTATDPDGESDTIGVTISVTDVDENPLMTRYDTNGTPGIQIDELQNAIADYYDGEIDISQLQVIIGAYFASSG